MAARDTGKEKLIKDTAKRIFFSEGKLHATTQDIADAAGISRTSLHYYYRSRDELMKQVFYEAAHVLNSELHSLMESALPFREKIEKMVHIFLAETMAYPYRETFLVIEMLSDSADVYKLKEETAPHIKAFLKEIKREMKAGRIRQMRPAQFLINLFALTSHPLLMRPLHAPLFNLSNEQYDRLIAERKKLIVDMIFG
jgi:AcrR family transcriptional regulator